MSADKLFHKIRNRVSAPLGHLRLSHRSSDAYIGAFPRSGSTWLRTILVNIMDPSANSNPDVFNARIPAVSIRNAPIINGLPSPRLIMTHSRWRRSIKKSVYLVRDGRDAFISSYHYHSTRNGVEMSIEDYYHFYINQIYGQTWEQHIESWLLKGQKTLGSQLLVISFEELKANTANVIEAVCNHLGISAQEGDVARAIDLASLDNAKKIERQRQGDIGDNNASFYRSGSSAQWKSPEYQHVMSKFQRRAKDALALAGY